MANKKAPKKTECPISLSDFLQHAKPLKVTLAGNDKIGEVKHFSTGSFGWNVTDKVVVEVNGVPLKVQAVCNLIVVGSKDAAADAPDQAA